MERDHLSRKLAVILHADVVGSTLLVQRNETLAHKRIQATFNNFSETIAAYGGIAREIRGDALVAEFERASDAVAAALAFQISNGEFNSTLCDDIKPQLRIGISLGEVIIADNTITGAGVVLAQRLEQLAEPDGVVVQSSVSETVPTRMPFEFESLGDQILKGFEQPVRAFSVSCLRNEELPAPEVTATPKTAGPEGLKVTDKPSIAVLPFTNMSGNPEQEYFADGIAEDIIANLCRYRELFVIDHHSTFTYRDGSSDAVLFAKELGVEYVVKGNIRRSKDQIRVSVQLIEAGTGKALWAKRVDRKIDDLFTLEDEVAAKIATSLVSHIEEDSSERARRKHPESMTAFDCVMRARRYARSYDPDHNALARGLLEQAVELDPEYATAYAYLAGSYCVEAETDWCKSRQEAIDRAVSYARMAVALDEFDSDSHAAMGTAYLALKNFDLAEVHIDRAIECNPNAYGAYCVKSWLLALSGRASEVKVCGTTALNLNPLAPDECLLAIIVAHYTEGRYDSALEMLARVREPDANSEAWRAACLAQLGRDNEAHQAAASAIEMDGNFIQREDWLLLWTFKNQQDLDHFVDGLHKSGVLPSVMS
jgi:TolB-like protein